jgi:Alr-MurF fusion protein
MTRIPYQMNQICEVTGGTLVMEQAEGEYIHELLIDSRRLVDPEHCLFIALVTQRNDGHHYISELYEKGVRNFLVSTVPENIEQMPGISLIRVDNTLVALQQLAKFHREQFQIPVIGVTGSNGKTIVKEWLFQLLSPDFRIIRSPKSYNSQVGVPLSVWRTEEEHTLAIFEAGISETKEMALLQMMIQPTIGVLTNIGDAHDEHFTGKLQKAKEKLALFRNTQIMIYSRDYPVIEDALATLQGAAALKTFNWSRKRKANLRIENIQKGDHDTVITALFKEKPISVRIPFTDDASVENAIHCWSVMIYLGYQEGVIERRMEKLVPIAFRLELKEAVNRCSLINDSYNSDVNSLGIAVDFLVRQDQHPKKTIILSDILQSGRNKSELYKEIAAMLAMKKIDRIIGIGRDLVKNQDKFSMQKAFFATTDDFLESFPFSSFHDETILLKGSRMFEFEKISNVLQQKMHETVMEISLDAIVHNLNFFRAKLQPGVKTMAMVKAFSYGSGSYEIANLLQFHHVDYLAVAYADEGVELRRAGISLPVMVMSPEEQSLDLLLKFNLEPEIYNLRILSLLDEAIKRNQTISQETIRIHLKMDTGMHRLGFSPDELSPLLEFLISAPHFKVQSIFSHLAASEDPAEDDFTYGQIRKFEEMSHVVTAGLGYPVLRHILNSAGISRFPGAQFNMVRLGIGLYGVGLDETEQRQLRNVSTLRSVVIQVRNIKAGDTIGYNRKGRAVNDMVIAVIPVGYADGLNRRLGNGKGGVYIRGEFCPFTGNICMDLCMIDISGLVSQGQQVREGDDVIIFDDRHPVSNLARELDTIPYEVLTGISRRVKRIYYHE